MTNTQSKIIDIITASPGATSRYITAELSLTHNWIQQTLLKMICAGHLYRIRDGHAYRYYAHDVRLCSECGQVIGSQDTELIATIRNMEYQIEQLRKGAR